MLASGFPPDEQYILRTAKFAEYLPEFGWTPVVLTPRNRTAARPGLVPPSGVRRYRIPGLPSPSRLAFAARQALSRPRAEREAATADAGPVKPARLPARRIRNALLWCDTPDALAGWIPAAAVSGWFLSRLGACAIHASGPPFSVVVAGALLARLLGLPLVGDFRDTWTLDPGDPIGTMSGGFRAELSSRRRRLLARLERWTLRRCAAVLFTSRNSRQLYADHYPDFADRFHLILNGADEADFVGTRDAFETPTLSHVGTLHEFQWEHLRGLLGLLAGLRASGSIPRRTRLALVGPLGAALRARIDSEARTLRIEDMLVLTGAIPHPEAVQWMRQSWLQLLFVGDNALIRLSKLSECVAAGRQMLAFGDPLGETCQEVRTHGGVVAPVPGSELAMATVVQALRERPAARPVSRIVHPHPLSRRTEAAELAGLLLQATETFASPA
jgi:glycosyltransferase involved in cell wall biosynthesis